MNEWEDLERHHLRIDAGGYGSGGGVVDRTLTCARCGEENPLGKKFCKKCGEELAVPYPTGSHPGTAAMPQAPAGPGPVPYAQAAPGTRAMPPGATTRRAGPLAALASLTALRERRGAALVAGAATVFTAGVVVLICTWLAWGRNPGGSLTGWGWYEVGRIAVSKGGDIATPLFVYFEGYPVFTGLCSLAVGAMMAMAGLFLALLPGRRVAGTAIAVSSLALCIAAVNFSSVLRQPDTGVGVGLILLAVFAAAGLAGGIIALRGSRSPVAAGADAAMAPQGSATGSAGTGTPAGRGR